MIKRILLTIGLLVVIVITIFLMTLAVAFIGSILTNLIPIFPVLFAWGVIAGALGIVVYAVWMMAGDILGE